MTGRLGHRAARLAVLGAALAAWVLSGLYTVPPTAVGVTRLFGVVTDAAVPAGVHWWWPWPFGRVDRAETARTFAMALGYRPGTDTPNAAAGALEGRWLTGDTNIVQVRARVTWRIVEPTRFLFSGENAEGTLRLAAGTAFTATSSRLGVDELLTSGRLALADGVRTRTQALLDQLGAGIQVLALDLEAVGPAPVVMEAFQAVQDARADRERLVSEAETWANGAVPLARGKAEAIVNQARGFHDQRVNAARGDAGRFAALAAEDAREPALLEHRLYLETVERVLPRVRRYVLDPGGTEAMPIRIVE